MAEREHQKFSTRKRVSSFAYAFAGLKELFRLEHNSRIHLAAAVLVSAAGFYFDITAFEWALLVFAIGLVFITEIVNSAIERIIDRMSPEHSEFARVVKDLAAAAVLVAAITSVLVGVLVFWKYVLG